MNGHYAMRAKLWSAVQKGLVTKQEAEAIEDLWSQEEASHRRRWSM